MIQVKFFTDQTLTNAFDRKTEIKLETQINKWLLSNKNVKVIDIKFSVNSYGAKALIICEV